MTNDEIALEKARQQFRGFGHASQGYKIIELTEAMALTKQEYKAIRGEIKRCLKESDFQDLEEYFR